MIIKNPEYFKMIANQRSVSKAAQALFITQPSLSIYLGKLEEELGVKLFDRTKIPLELTYAGQLYYDYILRYEELLAGMEREFREISGNDTGKLRIGVSHWTGLYFISSVIPEFAKRHPNMEILLRELSVHSLEKQLHNRELDICIMHTPYNDPSVVYDIILDERILLVGNINHPLVRAHPTSLDDPAHFDVRLLRNEQILLNEPEQILYRGVANMFSKYHIRPRIKITVTSTLTLVGLAARGMGFTFMPEFGQYYRNDFDQLAIYTVDDPILSWSLSAVCNHDAKLSPAARDFIEITKEILRSSSKRRNSFSQP